LFVNSETPKVVVEDSGNLKFGPTANLHAAGSNDAIRIVRGYVFNTSLATPNIGNSSGDFTVTRTGLGIYRINFAGGTFSSYPIVTASTMSTQTDNFMSVQNANTGYAILECWDNDTQVRQDSSFMFIAIGPR